MFRYYKRICLALFLPISIIPLVTIIAGIGSLLQSIMPSPLAMFLVEVPDVYIESLPLLWASSIAFYLSNKKDGTCILSAIIAYVVITQILSLTTISEALQSNSYQIDSAFQYIQNPFIGILCGCVAASIFNRFSHVQLPQGLAFFSGKRLIPILTGFIMIFVAALMFIVWPIIFHTLNNIQSFLLNNGLIGSSLNLGYQLLLLPFGLDQILENASSYQNNVIIIVSLVTTLACVLYYAVKANKREVSLFFILLAIVCIFAKQTMAIEFIILILSPLLYLFYIINVSVFYYLGVQFSIPFEALAVFASVAQFMFFAYYMRKKQCHLTFQDDEVNLDTFEVYQLLEAFGGIENIMKITSQKNELIVLVLDEDFFSVEKIKALGDYNVNLIKQQTYSIQGVLQIHTLLNEIQKIQEEELQSMLIQE